MKLIRSGASCGPDICGKYVFILNGQGFSVHPSIHPSIRLSAHPPACGKAPHPLRPQPRCDGPARSAAGPHRRTADTRRSAAEPPSEDDGSRRISQGIGTRRAKRRLRRRIRAANGIRRNRTTMRPRPTDRTGLRFLQRRDRPISTRSMRIIRSKPLSLFCDR